MNTTIVPQIRTDISRLRSRYFARARCSILKVARSRGAESQAQPSLPSLSHTIYHKNGPHYPVDPRWEIFQVENSRSRAKGLVTDALYANSREHHPWKPHNTPSSGRSYSSTPPSSHPCSPTCTLSLPLLHRHRFSGEVKALSLLAIKTFLFSLGVLSSSCHPLPFLRRIHREQRKGEAYRAGNGKGVNWKASASGQAQQNLVDLRGQFPRSHRWGRRFLFSSSINWPSVYFTSNTAVSTDYPPSWRNSVKRCMRII